jgi:hypothetical protein
MQCGQGVVILSWITLNAALILADIASLPDCSTAPKPMIRRTLM